MEREENIFIGWLRSFHMHEYAERFREYGIFTVRDACFLTKEDVKKLAMSDFHRARVLDAIERLTMTMPGVRPAGQPIEKIPPPPYDFMNFEISADSEEWETVFTAVVKPQYVPLVQAEHPEK